MKFRKSFLVLFALFILLGNSLALAVSDTPDNTQTSGETVGTTSGETTGTTSGETAGNTSGETTGNTSGELSGEIVPNLSGEISGDEYEEVLKSTASDSSFIIEKNATLTAAMEATTSGDETYIFNIVTAPSHGTVTQTSSGDPAFTYAPSKDYTGEDSFTFRLESGDVYSNIGTISITIKKPTSTGAVVIPFNYVDMQEHWANYSASHLAARGLIVGEEIGGKYYFCPEKQMTRSEFLLFLLAIVDPDNTAKVKDVTFKDEDEIPTWLLTKVKQAYGLGIISGVGSGKNLYFYPNRKITRSEAFVMINNALDAKATLTNVSSSGDLGYKDAKSIPSWALQAIKNLSGYKIVQGDSYKNVKPNGAVSRAEGAELSFKLLKELELQALTPSGDMLSGDMSGEMSNSGNVSGESSNSGNVSGESTASGDVTLTGNLQ